MIFERLKEAFLTDKQLTYAYFLGLLSIYSLLFRDNFHTISLGYYLLAGLSWGITFYLFNIVDNFGKQQ